MPIRAGNDETERDSASIDEEGTFRALFSPIDRGSPGGCAAAGCFDDAPVHDQVCQVQSDHLLVSIKAELVEEGKQARIDPLVSAAPDRGRGTVRVGDLFVGGSEDEDLDELVARDPVRDTGTVAAFGMRVVSTTSVINAWNWSQMGSMRKDRTAGTSAPESHGILVETVFNRARACPTSTPHPIYRRDR